MDQSGTPSKRVAWQPAAFNEGIPNESRPSSSRQVSRTGSRSNSRPNSPNSSSRASFVDAPGDNSMERPPHKRNRSKFGWQASRPRYNRSKSSTHTPSHSNPLGESAVPSTAIARLAQRTQNNLKMWYLRHSNGAASRRRTEIDKLREIEKSKLLFAQMFAVTPMVLISASSLQAEEGEEKKVPVVLQQLSIKVIEEEAKHYRNMLRIQLEYGSGLCLIKWEIVRGYRDLLYLRTKLKTRTKNGIRTKRVKLPKLPRPTNSTKRMKKKLDTQNQFNYEDSESDENEYYSSSEDEDDDDDDDEDHQFWDHSHNETENDGSGQQVSSGQNSLSAGRNTSTQVSLMSHNINGQFNGQIIGHANSYVDADVDAGADADNTGEHQHPSRPPMERSQSHQRSRKSHHKWSYAKAVEEWLNRIKYIYTFRSDTNDLMQFLELSHLSLKLSSEYSFHGKEGTVIVRSRASEMGWRVNHWHPRDIKDMIERHTRKWVLVRDSYLVIVDNIYSTRVREVFFVDSGFQVKHITEEQGDRVAEAFEKNDTDGVIEALPDAQGVHKQKGAKSVFLHLINNERELKLTATSERDLRRWQASILQMKARTPWSKSNRFGSFAPVRKNVFGQWFVDGRDYMWVLSEALENARDTIFILDWWLSPELYLRRPPEGNQKWRLDRVLKRKAEQGVKIFVIVYRNVGPTIPIDSMWTKHSLLDLHDNIHVMRSPNQLQNQGSLFWAHHEKLCIIDNTVAFNGGIDLCFGRWDTWQHTLTDDAPKPFLPKEPTGDEWLEDTQLFPGKDYSNARVKDFYDLNRPFDDMYDRGYVPRMPWHDIHQMVVGQPARDFARHFVQRWNYVLRQKIPSRPTPLLLPPADFSQEDLDRLQLTGTCEYQVLRSSGEWSLGLRKHEQSIQNAYLRLIEESEHLVYIENQFFITSTEVDGVLIENQIGNALVQRIVRAHESGEPWKAFILIPLMPGFEAEVDTDKASSVRVICQCQFNSISRGPNSIFYRLESLGIRPDQYINFFSLRKWGKFSDTPNAPNGGRVATELLYIHAKCMIVDDRVAIIGSANINERSMRGVRDSEVAVCVRDTKVVESKMAGKPWKAAKFAHSLRTRLMREHLGVDIDKFEIIEKYMDTLDVTAEYLKAERIRNQQYHQHGKQHQPLDPHFEQQASPKDHNAGSDYLDQFPEWLYPELHSFNWYAGTSINRGVRDYKKLSHDSRVQKNTEHFEHVNGDGFDHWKARQEQEEGVNKRREKAAEPDVEMENVARKILDELIKDRSISSREEFRRIFYARFTIQDILRPVKRASDLPLPHTDEDGLRAVNNENIPIDPWAFDDPLDDQFVNDKWLAVAERNTLIFRLVFRCQPDDEVETWKDYKTFVGHLERFYEKQREDGGPNALRESGHHEPDRVDKYVLDGSIKRPDPDRLRVSKIRATQTSYHPPAESQSNKERKKSTESLRTELYRKEIELAAHNDHHYEHLPDSEQVAFDEKLRKEFHFRRRSDAMQVEQLRRLSLEENEKHNGYFALGGDKAPNQGSEFTGSRPVPNENLPIINGKVKEKAHGTIEFPTVDDEPKSTTLEPLVSTTSGRRRAMTGGSAPMTSKPARKWGHFEHVLDAQVAEDMLQGITGHLVVFPTEWLNRELDSGNWNFQLDRIAPLEIYD